MKITFKKVYLFLSLVFLTFSCFVFWLLYKQINKNSNQADQTLLKWQTEATRRDEIKSLNHSVDKIQDEKTQLETHFAKSSDAVPFLDTLEKIAGDAGVKSEIISVDISPNKNSLLVVMNVAGSFESVYKFLMLLENSPYELEFTSVDLQRSGQDLLVGKNVKVKTAQWNATFKITLLSFEG